MHFFQLTTSCFQQSLRSHQPTTMKDLSGNQIDDLQKVLQLLQFPERLSASRNSSVTVSVGDQNCTDSGTNICSKSAEARKSTCSKQNNEGSIATSCINSKRNKSDMPNSVPHSFNDGSVPLSQDALLVDNVFTSPVYRETNTEEKWSVLPNTCTNVTARYDKLKSFLCVPLLDPSKSPSTVDHVPARDIRKVSLDENRCSMFPVDNTPALLACFVDKLPTDDSTSKSNMIEHTKPPERNRKINAACKTANSDEDTSLDVRKEVLNFDKKDVALVMECFK